MAHQNARGTVNISNDGVLSTQGNAVIGNIGQGTVSITGGEWNMDAGSLTIGDGINGRGELNLSDEASLTTTGTLTAGVAAAPNASTGTVTIKDSSIEVGNTTVNATGRLDVSGESLIDVVAAITVNTGGELNIRGESVIDAGGNFTVAGRVRSSEDAVIDVNSIIVPAGGRLDISGRSVIETTSLNNDGRVYVRGTGVKFDPTTPLLAGTGLFVLDHNTAWNLPGGLSALIGNVQIPNGMRIGLYSGTITLNNIRNASGHSPMYVMNNATLIVPPNSINITGGVPGWLTLNGGTVRWGAGNTADYSAILNTNAGGTLDLNGNNVEFANAINVAVTAGVASILTVTGGGSLTLNVAPTIAGDLRIEENTTLVLDANVTLPQGARVYNYGTVVVEEGVTLINNGSIINRGEVRNYGTVRNNFRIFSDDPIGGNFSGNPVESLASAPEDPTRPGAPGEDGAPGTPGADGGQGPRGDSGSGCNSGAFGLGAFAGVLVFFKKKKAA